MKKVINILLAICIVAMIYIVYGSIMGPIKFANEKGIRDKAVISRLMDIKAAQTEYNYQHGGYCDNFDSLSAFIKTAQLPITKKVGELTDDQLENNWTETKVLTLYAKARAAEQDAATLTGRKAANKKIEADTLWQRAATEGFIILHEDGTKEFLFSRETEFVSLFAHQMEHRMVYFWIRNYHNLQNRLQNYKKYLKKTRKICVFRKIVVPLHAFSGKKQYK